MNLNQYFDNCWFFVQNQNSGFVVPVVEVVVVFELFCHPKADVVLLFGLNVRLLFGFSLGFVTVFFFGFGLGFGLYVVIGLEVV
eukprot:UN00914